MNRADFEEFVYNIPNAINREQIHRKQKEVSWDKHLRGYFYDITISLFCKKFKVYDEQAKKYIYVEGKNTIPKRYREIRFMDSAMAKAPDAAFIDEENDVAIAIELDHGTKGSQLLNALSKAGMNVLLKMRSGSLKGFDKAVLIFIDESGTLKQYEQDKTYRGIINWFEKSLSTDVFII